MSRHNHVKRNKLGIFRTTMVLESWRILGPFDGSVGKQVWWQSHVFFYYSFHSKIIMLLYKWKKRRKKTLASDKKTKKKGGGGKKTIILLIRDFEMGQYRVWIKNPILVVWGIELICGLFLGFYGLYILFILLWTQWTVFMISHSFVLARLGIFELVLSIVFIRKYVESYKVVVTRASTYVCVRSNFS